MDGLGLYKFITDHNIEWHKINGDSDIILFINNYLLDDWNKLLGYGITDEDGISCTMKNNYFCFMMKDICEYYGIDIEKVFVGEWT